MSEADEIWLTQEAYDRLLNELAERSGARRTEITKRIEVAREEGDLRENGGYHAAKDDQGKNEARIRQLRHMLENAQVGSPAATTDGTVGHGTVVSVRFADGEVETFLLGSREEAAHTSVDVYSPTSPLGSAVLGQAVGTEVAYELPNGRTISVEIVSVDIYQG